MVGLIHSDLLEEKSTNKKVLSCHVIILRVCCSYVIRILDRDNFLHAFILFSTKTVLCRSI